MDTNITTNRIPRNLLDEEVPEHRFQFWKVTLTDAGGTLFVCREDTDAPVSRRLRCSVHRLRVLCGGRSGEEGDSKIIQ